MSCFADTLLLDTDRSTSFQRVGVSRSATICVRFVVGVLHPYEQLIFVLKLDCIPHEVPRHVLDGRLSDDTGS